MELLIRHNIEIFLKWNESPIRSPLVLIGPRQVGKTTLLKTIASKIGQNVWEVNFWEDRDHVLKNIFRHNSSCEKILSDLADYFEIASINIKDDVLFIDEIQECPEAYAALKNFKEKYPKLRILVTGSYLQLFLKNEEVKQLPVGCVDEFYLGPLTFAEFLENIDPVLFEKFKKLDLDNFVISEILHEKLFEKFNEYCFTGGLPEVVYLYRTQKDNFETRQAVRKKQKDLINQYVLDFQKYGKGVHVKKIDKIFQNIPIQLEKTLDQSTDRFIFKDLGTNIKYNSLHWSFQFLKNAGLIIRSYIVSKIDLPFRVHEQNEDRNIFKCFYFDVGLLGAALDSPISVVLSDLGSYKGYIAENFVAIALYGHFKKDLITYKKTSKQDSAEIEFLISDMNGSVIPIEVKSSRNSLRSKSLDSFVETFNPKRSYKLVPTTGMNIKNKKYISLPLYMIDKIIKNVE